MTISAKLLHLILRSSKKFYDPQGQSIGINNNMTDVHQTGKNFQHTLKNEISCSGTGLHTGDNVSIILKPAPEDNGIVFRRTDVAGNNAEIHALVDNVVEATLCTTLGNDEGIKIATVEHLLAALAGCKIDNVFVDVDGPLEPERRGNGATTNAIYMLMPGTASDTVMKVRMGSVDDDELPPPAALRRGGAEGTVGGLSVNGSGPVTLRFDRNDGSFFGETTRVSAGGIVEIDPETGDAVVMGRKTPEEPG